MQSERPEKLIDPVCGMTVDVATAEAAGLLVELDGRTYAFCRQGCKRAFTESPPSTSPKPPPPRPPRPPGSKASR